MIILCIYVMRSFTVQSFFFATFLWIIWRLIVVLRIIMYVLMLLVRWQEAPLLSTINLHRFTYGEPSLPGALMENRLLKQKSKAIELYANYTDCCYQWWSPRGHVLGLECPWGHIFKSLALALVLWNFQWHISVLTPQWRKFSWFVQRLL